MNAASRKIEKSTLFHGSLGNLRVTRDFIGLLMLIAFTVISAITVVYIRNYERTLVSELQLSHSEKHRLEVEWSQLLLEESTWSTPARIQLIAQHEYDMQVPNGDKVVMVKL